MTPADEPTPAETPAPAHFTAEESAHPDPITGEAGAHPIGVGIGAIGAGLAGAAIGMVAGPVGAAIGAAIGAVAGGLAGKEVAAVEDEPRTVDSTPLTAGVSDSDPTGLPAAHSTDSSGGNVAGSNIGETNGISAGQFHDAFTATTLHETEAENRLSGDDAPDEATLPEDVTGTSALGIIPFDHTSGRTEHVRTAAYFRFLDRKRQGLPGDDLGDWIAAEREHSVG